MKVKFVHHLLSSNKTNYSIKHACPFYKIREDSETPHDHFLTCKSSESNKVCRIAKLKAYLTLLDTPNTITVIIIRGIRSFYYNSIQPPLNQLSPTFLNIQQHQEAIGWNHFARVRVPKQITDYMDFFHHNTNIKRTSTSWINSIIKLNLEVHLTERKNYCNMIPTPRLGSRGRHPQGYAKDIHHEPSKWLQKI